MESPEFQAYRSARLAEGFDEVLERSWQHDVQLDTHTHPFAATARVVQGEMWLTVDGAARHLLPGDSFELAREVPHAERYGPSGATYWVARRHG